MRDLLALSLGLLCVVTLAGPADADTFVFRGTIHVGSPQDSGTNSNGRGRQTLDDLALGIDFVVVRAGVVITHLGLWDDNGDGVASPHGLAIHDTSTRALLASLEAGAGTGFLFEGYRYFPLATPLPLAPGEEFSVVVHYPEGNRDSNGNSGRTDQSLEPNPAFNGGGVILNVGTSRYGFGPGFPLRADTGPSNRYHAGSFAFVSSAPLSSSNPIPEPVTLLLVPVAFGVFLFLRRRG